jgi:hypothetical protein
MHPKQRQAVFWEWADCRLHSRCVDTVTCDGTQLDIQVRTSRQGVVQLFIGIYTKTGAMVIEEYHPDRHEQSMTLALKWGEDRARAFCIPLPLPHPRLTQRLH